MLIFIPNFFKYIFFTCQNIFKKNYNKEIIATNFFQYDSVRAANRANILTSF